MHHRILLAHFDSQVTQDLHCVNLSDYDVALLAHQEAVFLALVALLVRLVDILNIQLLQGLPKRRRQLIEQEDQVLLRDPASGLFIILLPKVNELLDLVSLDLMLPGMSGNEFLQTLSSRKETARIPVRSCRPQPRVPQQHRREGEPTSALPLSVEPIDDRFRTK